MGLSNASTCVQLFSTLDTPSDNSWSENDERANSKYKAPKSSGKKNKKLSLLEQEERAVSSTVSVSSLPDGDDSGSPTNDALEEKENRSSLSYKVYQNNIIDSFIVGVAEKARN